MCITLITSEFQRISYAYKMTCLSTFNCPFMSFSHFAIVLFVISLLIWSCIPLKQHSYLQHWSFCNISSACFNSEYVKSLLFFGQSQSQTQMAWGLFLTPAFKNPMVLCFRQVKTVLASLLCCKKLEHCLPCLFSFAQCNLCFDSPVMGTILAYLLEE